jgi:dienelactone hydrolase
MYQGRTDPLVGRFDLIVLALRRTLWILLSMLLTTPTVRAAIVTQHIEYKDGDTTLEGILAFEDAVPVSERRPGVLVCHTWWGVDDYVEGRAKQLAELGYVAFALDVFGKGTHTDDPKKAAERMQATIADLPALRRRAALGLKVLAQQARVDSERLGVIGYCFGGTVALELARSGLEHTESLRAVVAFHAARLAATGTDDETARLSRNVRGSVLICHGAVDPLVKPGEVDTLQRQFEAAKVDYVFVAYAGALHAFTDRTVDARNIATSKYNANADHRSWEHMASLFEDKLPIRSVPLKVPSPGP